MKWDKWNTIVEQQTFHWWYIYHARCLKGWPFVSFHFLFVIIIIFFCIYKCRTLGHWYKQKSYFTPLISSVEDSLGFGLMILMFFWWWWRMGGDGAEPPYALLSSGFVRMLLSLCTLISIVSGLRDSFPFSSFSGNFLRRRRKRRGEREIRSSSWTGNDAEIKKFGIITFANQYLLM